MYAVFEVGSKQYRVKEGDEILIDRQAQVEKDKSISFDSVLLVKKDSDLKIGQPFVSGAKVSAKVLDHVKDEKLYIYKYKRKTGYHKKTGHRQPLTLIKIEKISG
jgi:large subunit ribosomal protein L21